MWHLFRAWTLSHAPPCLADPDGLGERAHVGVGPELDRLRPSPQRHRARVGGPGRLDQAQSSRPLPQRHQRSPGGLQGRRPPPITLVLISHRNGVPKRQRRMILDFLSVSLGLIPHSDRLLCVSMTASFLESSTGSCNVAALVHASYDAADSFENARRP
jgi:hypothetical protein